jgi:hypothetical protein
MVRFHNSLCIIVFVFALLHFSDNSARLALAVRVSLVFSDDTIV